MKPGMKSFGLLARTCRHCKGSMKIGTALKNTLTWGNDFGGEAQISKPPRGVTISASGPPVMVRVMKCVDCGYSVTG